MSDQTNTTPGNEGVQANSVPMGPAQQVPEDVAETAAPTQVVPRNVQKKQELAKALNDLSKIAGVSDLMEKFGIEAGARGVTAKSLNKLNKDKLKKLDEGIKALVAAQTQEQAAVVEETAEVASVANSDRDVSIEGDDPYVEEEQVEAVKGGGSTDRGGNIGAKPTVETINPDQDLNPETENSQNASGNVGDMHGMGVQTVLSWGRGMQKIDQSLKNWGKRGVLAGLTSGVARIATGTAYGVTVGMSAGTYARTANRTHKILNKTPLKFLAKPVATVTGVAAACTTALWAPAMFAVGQTTNVAKAAVSTWKAGINHDHFLKGAGQHIWQNKGEVAVWFGKTTAGFALSAAGLNPYGLIDQHVIDMPDFNTLNDLTNGDLGNDAVSMDNALGNVPSNVLHAGAQVMSFAQQGSLQLWSVPIEAAAHGIEAAAHMVMPDAHADTGADTSSTGADTSDTSSDTSSATEASEAAIEQLNSIADSHNGFEGPAEPVDNASPARASVEATVPIDSSLDGSSAYQAQQVAVAAQLHSAAPSVAADTDVAVSSAGVDTVADVTTDAQVAELQSQIATLTSLNQEDLADEIAAREAQVAELQSQSVEVAQTAAGSSDAAATDSNAADQDDVDQDQDIDPRLHVTQTDSLLTVSQADVDAYRASHPSLATSPDSVVAYAFARGADGAGLGGMQGSVEQVYTFHNCDYTTTSAAEAVAYGTDDDYDRANENWCEEDCNATARGYTYTPPANDALASDALNAQVAANLSVAPPAAPYSMPAPAAAVVDAPVAACDTGCAPALLGQPMPANGAFGLPAGTTIQQVQLTEPSHTVDNGSEVDYTNEWHDDVEVRVGETYVLPSLAEVDISADMTFDDAFAKVDAIGGDQQVLLSAGSAENIDADWRANRSEMVRETTRIETNSPHFSNHSSRIIDTDSDQMRVYHTWNNTLAVITDDNGDQVALSIREPFDMDRTNSEIAADIKDRLTIETNERTFIVNDELARSGLFGDKQEIAERDLTQQQMAALRGAGVTFPDDGQVRFTPEEGPVGNPDTTALVRVDVGGEGYYAFGTLDQMHSDFSELQSLADRGFLNEDAQSVIDGNENTANLLARMSIFYQMSELFDDPDFVREALEEGWIKFAPDGTIMIHEDAPCSEAWEKGTDGGGARTIASVINDVDVLTETEETIYTILGGAQLAYSIYELFGSSTTIPGDPGSPAVYETVDVGGRVIDGGSIVTEVLVSPAIPATAATVVTEAGTVVPLAVTLGGAATTIFTDSNTPAAGYIIGGADLDDSVEEHQSSGGPTNIAGPRAEDPANDYYPNKVETSFVREGAVAEVPANDTPSYYKESHVASK